MAPIVVARGDERCNAFYTALLAELSDRNAGTQKTSVYWDAIPIWPMKNRLQQLLDNLGAVIVTSTFASWWFYRHDTAQNCLGLPR